MSECTESDVCVQCGEVVPIEEQPPEDGTVCADCEFRTWRLACARQLWPGLLQARALLNRFADAFEDGPDALVPTPRELFDDGETVESFVACALDDWDAEAAS